MRRARRTSALVLIVFTLGSRSAQAEWSAQVTGPDVFGNTTVVASINNAIGNGLVVQCDQSKTLDIAYLMAATASEIDEISKSSSGLPATLLIKIDQGAVVKFDANLQAWNDSYIGVVASGRTADIAAIITGIGKATAQINVGASVFGTQESDVFDVANSTNAMATAISDCKLNSINSATNGSTSSSP